MLLWCGLNGKVEYKGVSVVADGIVLETVSIGLVRNPELVDMLPLNPIVSHPSVTSYYLKMT
jgi:hypothetical protein